MADEDKGNSIPNNALIDLAHKLESKRYEPAFIDLENKNSSHSLIVELTGRGKCVLEIGTSTGYITKILSEQGNRVIGIEIDVDAAEIARQYCESMVVGDVEELDLDAYIEPASIDVILLADVLEHLRWPSRVLDKVKKYLKPNGYLVVSIPNVSHGDLLLNLLNGDFRYTPMGLLDETHLRFFGRRNIINVFSSCGYDIKDVRTTQVHIGATELALDLNRLPQELLKFIRALPDSEVYQFVFKAIPSVATGNKSIPDVDFDKVVSVFIEDVLKEHESNEIALSKQLQQANTQVATLNYEIDNMKKSIAWQMTAKFHECFVEKTLPQGSRRRDWYDLGLKGCRILANDGWDSFKISLQMYFNHKAAFNKNNYKKLISALELTKDEIDIIRKECEGFKYRPKISIITPVWNTDERWLKSAIDSVLNQIYNNWELCIVDDASTTPHVREILNDYHRKDSRIKVRYLSKNLGISGASNEAISLATGEYMGLLDHDDELTPSALFQVVKLLNENYAIDFIYSDEISTREDGRPRYALFRPDFSIDYILSHCYIVHFVIIKSDIVRKIGGFRNEFKISQDYDLFLRAICETKNIYHIPKILYKWREHYSSSGHKYKSEVARLSKKAIQDFLDREGINGIALETEHFNYFKVKRFIKDSPKVSIIITVKDRSDLLKKCIESIKDKSIYSNYELIIIEKINEEDEDEELKYTPNSHRHKIFNNINYSESNNFAAKYAQGEHLLFLENDVEVISPEWIDSMIEHSQRKEVGCVGAKLLYPNNKIQHAGVVIWEKDCEKYIYEGWDSGDIGYMGQLISTRNCSAVTGACMMVKKDVFEEIGGFDENFKVEFMDLDFCLRAEEKGYLNVFTAHAKLYHDDLPKNSMHTSNTFYQKDRRYFIDRWQGVLHRGDPFYNPNLPIEDNNFISYVYFG